MNNQKQAIIKAIKEMDITMLEVILDDDGTYMNVSKETFIAKLAKEFDELRKEGLKGFHRVVEGTCGTCNKGCGGYSFITLDCQYIDLLFKEKNGKVTDLFLCRDFQYEEDFLKKHKIDFTFYKEDEIGYNPSPELLLSMNAVDKATKEFDGFRNNITDIKDVSVFFEKYKYIEYTFSFMDWMDYRFMKEFMVWYRDLDEISHIVNNSEEWERRLAEFRIAEKKGEKAIVEWLLKYDEYGLKNYSHYFVKIDNSSIFSYKMDASVLIDFSDYSKSLEYFDVFRINMRKMLDRFAPDQGYKDKYLHIIGFLQDYIKEKGIYPELVEKYYKENI